MKSLPGNRKGYFKTNVDINLVKYLNIIIYC